MELDRRAFLNMARAVDSATARINRIRRPYPELETLLVEEAQNNCMAQYDQILLKLQVLEEYLIGKGRL